jgi:ketosteroid isomerase-like protein
MSRENVEIVRRIYDEWGQGNFRAGVERFDPNILLVLRSEFLDAGAYVGPERVATYMRDLLADWSDLAIEGEGFTAAGDSVVVEVRQHGTGTSSRLATEDRYFQVWTLRGDTIIRIETIRDRAQALEAVGLSE